MFLPATWIPDITAEIPDNVCVGDFVLQRRQKEATDRPPLICATTDRTYSIEQVIERVGLLTAALGRDLGWPSDETPSNEKIVGVMCLNSVCVTG